MVTEYGIDKVYSIIKSSSKPIEYILEPSLENSNPSFLVVVELVKYLLVIKLALEKS